ncbi:MAG: integrase zinc binding domain-containing protein, partial [Candidatus Thiodiazotropha endolucinida]
CQQDKKDWEQFFEEVDDVVDLRVTVPCAQMQTKFSEGESECLRAFTRGQAKRNKVQEESTSPVSGAEALGHAKISPETMFVPSYTIEDIQRLQREDTDLEILHIWMDVKKLPSRDEVAQYSPAVRKYWLNTENIIRREGILYQKRWTYHPESTLTLQLLVPKTMRKEIIRNNHDTFLAGHFGVNKTINRIRLKFFTGIAWTQIFVYTSEDVISVIEERILPSGLKQN